MFTSTITGKTPCAHQEQEHRPALLAPTSVSMVLINDRKTYIPVTSCVVNYMLADSHMTDSEKIFYLLANLYAKLNKSFNSERSTEKSAKEWGQLLNRSEQHVFQMQKNLEQLGYFHIVRDKDEDNQNEKNIITPMLPKNVFNELIKKPNRIGSEHILFNDQETSQLSYLDDTKMFIKFNLPMFKMVIADHDLSSLQKLIWIYFFYRSYISYNNQNGDGTRHFITNYQEISSIFDCEECTVSVAINALAKLGFISKRQFRLQNTAKHSRRKKKSCWEICALIPETQMKELLQQKDRQNLAPLTLDDFRLYGLSGMANTASSFQVQVHWQLIHQPSENKAATTTGPAAIGVVNSSAKICNSSNSYTIEGDAYETMQYYNKYNILNTKNIVTEISNIDNIISASNDSNVFIEQELITDEKDLAAGLLIAAKFDEDVLELSKNIPYPQAIKQVDLTISSQEHWLVTRTAYSLLQKLNVAMKSQYGILLNRFDPLAIKLKEELFTTQEQALMELWVDFSETPMSAKNEEFLLRTSWLLKLLSTKSVDLKPKLANLGPANKPQESIVIAGFSADKTDKAKKFAQKLRAKALAKGYAANISITDLEKEFIYHAANWVPERLNCKTREQQIDAALSFAWKAAEQGIWKCPYKLLNAQIVQREQDSVRWKNY